MNTPKSVKGSTSKKNSDSSPNIQRGTLEKKGVRYDDQVLPLQETENFLELPRHVDCVRQSLLNFTYSLPSSIDIFDCFEAQRQKLVDKLEVGSYQNWSFFPPSDSEQHSVWWTSADSYPSRGPDPREIPLWANVEECNQAVKNLKSERLGVEIDWTERLRSAIFRKYDEKAVEAKDEPQSVSGVPASHEIEPFERWCLARDVWWTEANSFEKGSSGVKVLKDPKPDLTYAFPILSAPCTGFAAQETLGTTFSLDVLQELRKDDHIELISAPTTGLKNRSTSSSRKVLNNSDLMCFPWAVVEVKQPRVEKSEVEKCHCQAANGSAMALRMLGALFRNATGCVPTDLPPIIAITCVGPELRVWLTYNAGTGGQREDNMTPQKAKKEAVSNFESIGSLEVDALVIELEDLVAKFQKLGVSASSTPIQETRRSSYYYVRRKALAAITWPSQGHGDDLGPRREPTVEKIFGVEDGWQQFWDLVVGASDYDHGSDVALTLILASAVVLTVVALTDF
ncbi:hypothetical protein KC333_g7061 [Hortaea werneckii]|nr:hypothetical protein KC333_g7061 [Hortaea werneckii]KAI7309396.1 hypothetical protein KC326_g7047 [Hortaea werneckii]